MELSEFVSETLVQIATGVEDAAKKLQAIGAKVNPGTEQGRIAESVGRDGAMYPIQQIQFDVALSVSEDSSTGGHGGIKIASVFGVGAEKSNAQSHRSESRIQFTVPMVLP